MAKVTITMHAVSAKCAQYWYCCTVYEALLGGAHDLPYLLSVSCGDNTSGEVTACPELRFDYEASFTGGLVLLTIDVQYLSNSMGCRKARRSYG